MLFNFTEVHKKKIEKFTLLKKQSYKEQIEYYLRHLADLTHEYFPLQPYAYKVVEEYSDVVIAKLVNESDIKKYNQNDLIFVNQPQTEYN